MSMTPINIPQPQDKNGPSAARILELKTSGYSVQVMSDLNQNFYGWQGPAGASQSHYKDRQPYRRSIAQAWADCDDYYSCCIPSVANADWMASAA